MEIDWSVWGPPTAVLGVGVLIAAALTARTAPADGAKVEETERRRDLEARHAAMVRALRELDLEKDKLAPVDYESQRAALLASGAAALRALEGATATAAPGSPPPAPISLSGDSLAALRTDRDRLGDAAFARALAAAVPDAMPAPSAPPGMAPEWKGALYAFGAMFLVGLLAWSAGDIAKPRDGGSMSGGMGGGGMGAAASAPAPQSKGADNPRLLAAVEANPNDLQALNELTIGAMTREDLPTAMQWSSKALEVNPKDPEARVNRALIKSIMGMDAAALSQLDEVIADTPQHPTAHVYKGLILLRAGRGADAVPYLEQAIALGLDNPEIQSALAEAKAIGNRGEMPTDAAPAAGGPGAPPHGGMGAPPPPSGGGELLFAGTIDLDPAAVAAAQRGANVYVSVKNPAGGPPLAAKKLPVGPFPMSFTVTTADRPPMGASAPIPPAFDVTVRVDLDGNAMTKDPTEPLATSAGVAAGTQGLAFTLRAP